MGKMHKNYKWEVLVQSLISVINNILSYLYNQLCFSHKRLRKDTIILPKSYTGQLLSTVV